MKKNCKTIYYFIFSVFFFFLILTYLFVFIRNTLNLFYNYIDQEGQDILPLYKSDQNKRRNSLKRSHTSWTTEDDYRNFDVLEKLKQSTHSIFSIFIILYKIILKWWIRICTSSYFVCATDRMVVGDFVLFFFRSMFCLYHCCLKT